MIRFFPPLRLWPVLASLADLVAALPGQGNLAAAQSIVAPSGAPVALKVGRGVLITLDQPADTVFVADTSIADVQAKSPQLIFVYGKAPGDTSIYAVDANKHVLLSRPVTVTRDLASLRSVLASQYPHVRVTSVGQSVVVSGAVATPGDAEEVKRLALAAAGSEAELINRLKVYEPTQVNLRVRIAEVDHSVVKDLGLNWDIVTHPGSFMFGIATGSPASFSTDPSTEASNLISNNASTAADSIVAGVSHGRTLIDSVIDALDQNGLLNTLAEPNLTTTSGQTASFLAGGEFPIFIPAGSLGQATVEFKQYGVSLSFTPVILPNGLISLRVRPEVSELSTSGEVEINGTTIPALTTRRADTTVELGSGESFAIGGLLENNITNTANNLPGLATLPVLGPLFRSTQFQHGETELVIIVTPYLVRPSTGQLPLPTDGYTPPTDDDLFARGHDYGTPAPAAPVVTAPDSHLVGAAGFVLN